MVPTSNGTYIKWYLLGQPAGDLCGRRYTSRLNVAPQCRASTSWDSTFRQLARVEQFIQFVSAQVGHL